MDADYKKCPDCLEILPLESFCREKKTRSGRGAQCNRCHNARKLRGKQRAKAGLSKPRVEFTKLRAIEALLQDGEWHSTDEIRNIGGMSYMGRLSELRTGQGLQIVKRRDYGASHGWMYRLVTDPAEFAATGDSSPREQLLNLLRDGRWHSNQEMFDLMNVSYQDHLYFLRKEGFVINKMRDPETGVWHYKLEI